MRIVSGTHKGRRINPPKNLPVRPTTDLAKESLFNILNNYVYFTDLNVLDLFAGTGSITLEFASREVKSVTAVDLNYHCVSFIKKMASEFGFENIRPFRADVFRFLKRPPLEGYDLIFSDAPYDLEGIYILPDLILGMGWLKKNARLIVEHPKHIDYSGHQYFREIRNYGKVYFSFFIQD